MRNCFYCTGEREQQLSYKTAETFATFVLWVSRWHLDVCAKKSDVWPNFQCFISLQTNHGHAAVEVQQHTPGGSRKTGGSATPLVQTMLRSSDDIRSPGVQKTPKLTTSKTTGELIQQHVITKYHYE